jgi:hypothetical protein
MYTYKITPVSPYEPIVGSYVDREGNDDKDNNRDNFFFLRCPPRLLLFRLCGIDDYLYWL